MRLPIGDLRKGWLTGGDAALSAYRKLDCSLSSFPKLSLIALQPVFGLPFRGWARVGVSSLLSEKPNGHLLSFNRAVGRNLLCFTASA
ncbi:hypothetical protein ABIE33_000188 [Ensifer sp. 4252]